MEPVKGGLLAGKASPVTKFLHIANPEISAAAWAMRFAAALEGVSVVLSGMSNMEQMCENIDTLQNLKPFTSQEFTVLTKAAELLNNIPRIPCTGCAYCVDSCPMHIKIPHFIDFLNEILVYNSDVKARGMYELYTGDGCFASTCTRCHICESRCPQKLNIANIISLVSDKFDRA
jgi:predicted aldo/keto reductase-like oxidoreductase